MLELLEKAKRSPWILGNKLKYQRYCGAGESGHQQNAGNLNLMPQAWCTLSSNQLFCESLKTAMAWIVFFSSEPDCCAFKTAIMIVARHQSCTSIGWCLGVNHTSFKLIHVDYCILPK